MTSASVQSSVDTRPRPLFTNAKYRRFVFRRMLDAAVWLIFGLTTVLATSAAVLAQIHPAAFAGPKFSVKRPAIIAVGQADPIPLVEIATTSSFTNPDAVFRRTSANAAWGLLGVALSILAVLNLAIFSHLRRTYAPKRRSEGRKQGYPPCATRGAIELPQSRL